MSTTNGKTYKHDLPLGMFIDGKWEESAGGQYLTQYSALDESVVTEKLTCATATDVDRAVDSCEKALKGWQAVTPEKKRDVLNKWADLIMENAERLAYLEAIVVGKAAFHKFEVGAFAETIRYYAGYTDKIQGGLAVSEDGFLRGTLLQPLGVCAAIIPFNSPLITLGAKVAPALVCGNTVVVKTSEFNAFSALAVAELAVQAGIPAGVLNVVAGAGEAGQTMSSHMKIRKISFTGSPIVGRKVQVAAAMSNLKRVTLELGGKSPVVVFDDADLDSAVQESTRFLLFNGQGCVLGTRILVQDTIIDKFTEKFVAKVKAAGSQLGADPFAATTMGSPVYHKAQFDRVIGMIDRAKSEATCATGGNRHGDKGLYVEPTVFTHPKEGAEIVRDEVFGPVAVVIPFKTEEDALRIANDTEYGLGGYVFTNSMDRAIRMAKELEAGVISVNVCGAVHKTLPFGGWKSSGLGAENAEYVLRAFTQPKGVTIKFKPSP